MTQYSVGYTLEDAYGRNTSKKYLVEAVDVAAARTAASDMAADLAQLTEAQILWYTVAEKITYSDTVDAGANKDEGVTFVVRKTDNEKATIKVPAPINAIFNTDGTVDLTNSAVSSFMANFLSGVFLVSDGEVVDSLLSGRLDE